MMRWMSGTAASPSTCWTAVTLAVLSVTVPPGPVAVIVKFAVFTKPTAGAAGMNTSACSAVLTAAGVPLTLYVPLLRTPVVAFDRVPAAGLNTTVTVSLAPTVGSLTVTLANGVLGLWFATP